MMMGIVIGVSCVGASLLAYWLTRDPFAEHRKMVSKLGYNYAAEQAVANGNHPLFPSTDEAFASHRYTVESGDGYSFWDNLNPFKKPVDTSVVPPHEPMLSHWDARSQEFWADPLNVANPLNHIEGSMLNPSYDICNTSSTGFGSSFGSSFNDEW